MSTETTTTDMRELQEVLDQISKGIRDPEAAREARECLDREREELRKKIGTVNIAVDLIREARNP